MKKHQSTFRLKHRPKSDPRRFLNAQIDITLTKEGKKETRDGANQATRPSHHLRLSSIQYPCG